MTVTACYVLLAVLVAPILVNLGVYPLGAHLFVLYWGMVSYFTPPVAIGAFTAAGLAGASPMQTAFKSVMLGIVKFFIPFFFVIEPALLLHGGPGRIAISICKALLGVMLVGSAMEGYLLKLGKLNGFQRTVLVAAGCLIAFPGLKVTVIGLLLAGLVILPGVLQGWREKGNHRKKIFWRCAWPA